VPSESQLEGAANTGPALALRDVELDWYKVLGYRALIYSNSSWKPSTELDTGSATVFFGDANRHSWLESTFDLKANGCGLERGAEAHCLLRVDSFSWNGEAIKSPAIVAVGNGTRGAIFAAYAFSEMMLGVAPFYRFTFDQPRWTGKSFPAPTSVQAWAPPQFKHRAIFLNDEELLGFFRRDPLGEQIFDMATVDSILETLLRAKVRLKRKNLDLIGIYRHFTNDILPHLHQANTILMGTTPYPDERSLKLAARRGVVITASHFEILGFNAFAWDKSFGHASRDLWDWTTVREA
jgi:hypothetical protein